VTIGDDEFKKDIEFPTGWVQETQKGDGADDYFGFSTTFTVRYLVILYCMIRFTVHSFCAFVCLFIRLRMIS
jgi:hypothetical protein